MIIFQLKKDVSIDVQGAILNATNKFTSITYKSFSSAAAVSLKKRLETGFTEESFTEFVFEIETYDNTFTLFYFLELLKGKGFFYYQIYNEESLFAQFTPLGLNCNLVDSPADLNGLTVYLSRFALLREEENFLIETPLLSGCISLIQPVSLLLLYSITKPISFDEIQNRNPSLDSVLLKSFFQLLISAKICLVVEHANDEENDTALQQWEFHDLYFHTRSRIGRHQNPFGGIYPFKGKIPPPPAMRDFIKGKKIVLYKPDLDQIKKCDLPFTEVLEARKSLRQPSAEPLHSNQLGEFLFRTAHIKRFNSEGPMEVTFRPSPSGGASHELEIYPLILSCEGIEKGLYHYEPHKHLLTEIIKESREVIDLANDAKQAMGGDYLPHVVIIISARFQRVSWKYRSMAYATILKNTGVLIQTMYLVATAMQLAPCAIGGGNSDLFSKILGINYFEEN